MPPKGMSFREWSTYYAKVKKLEQAGKFGKAEEKELLSKGIPEMLKGSARLSTSGRNGKRD